MGIRQTVREAFDLIMYTGSLTGFKHFLLAGGNSAVTDVVHNGVVEKNRVLGYDADSVAETASR